MVSRVAPAEITETTGIEHALRRAPTGGRLPGDWEQVSAANVLPIYRFVYARTGNRPDAEGVTSKIFLTTLPQLRVGA
jgi:DNA-directed RNA polymerase specialized sigma24 family protein